MNKDILNKILFFPIECLKSLDDLTGGQTRSRDYQNFIKDETKIKEAISAIELQRKQSIS